MYLFTFEKLLTTSQAIVNFECHCNTMDVGRPQLNSNSRLSGVITNSLRTRPINRA